MAEKKRALEDEIKSRIQSLNEKQKVVRNVKLLEQKLGFN